MQNIVGKLQEVTEGLRNGDLMGIVEDVAVQKGVSGESQELVGIDGEAACVENIGLIYGELRDTVVDEEVQKVMGVLQENNGM